MFQARIEDGDCGNKEDEDARFGSGSQGQEGHHGMVGNYCICTAEGPGKLLWMILFSLENVAKLVMIKRIFRCESHSPFEDQHAMFP